MLGKVITLKKDGPTARGFVEAVRYVSRTDKEAEELGQAPIAAGEMGLANLEGDLDSADDLLALASAMNATAYLSQRFKGNPVYHLTVNWQTGEHPTRDQAAGAAAKMLEALGMSECEALWAIHRDTDNDHMHLLVNRVHPERGIVAGPPRFDYLLIDKACRELELDQGWRHSAGPYVVMRSADDQEPEIKRVSKKERERRGLIGERGFELGPEPAVEQDIEAGPGPSQRAGRAARNQAAPPFQAWIAGDPGQALRQRLDAPGADWQAVHECLAGFGLELRPKGSGLVVAGRHDGQEVMAKASQLGRFASKAALEKRLGDFVPAEAQIGIDADGATSYGRFVHDFQMGGDITESGRSDQEREERRNQRAQAREALKLRFLDEQEARKEERQARRKQRTAKHAAERKELRERLASRRGAFIASKISQGMDAGMARSLWALEAAKEREGLAAQHAAERADGDELGRSLVWRDWVQKEAEKGDPAAESAWRGIRYRDKRAGGEHRNGIEGVPIGEPESLTFAKLQAEADRRRGEIRYKTEDGRHLFTDTGPRIEMHTREEDAVRLGLRVAAQKFGGSVEITGSGLFREQAAREAARLGIGVKDQDLRDVWEQEREAMQAPYWEREGPER
ncbi:MAG: relaxase/mobilization nuclease domain-containing protein [Acidihalobacter sp.]|uniref:TraI/MobA(P) family conjugative relaxase n=1 Tax=Acidihalobacter sp. TaxID=1872108 RepID=UPI00307EE2AE